MSHFYVQQILHVIWSTQDQQFEIPKPIRDQLYSYISEIIKTNEGKLYFAGGHNNHVHCLLSLPPHISIGTLMRFIKANSSKWIKYQKSILAQFSWEDGYTAISLQYDRLDAVCSYIKNEEERHITISYGDELSTILKLQNIPYNEQFFLKNSHSKILMHAIWSTKNRTPYINKSIRPALYQVIFDKINKMGCITHSIGGIEDHVHLLIEISRTIALSDLVKEIKAATSHWMTMKDLSLEWQTGYGAFSLSVPTLEIVKEYIIQQEEHHKHFDQSNEWNEFIMKKGLISR